MSPPRTHRMTCKQGLGQSAQGRFGTPVLGEHGMPSLGRWDGQQYPRCINSQPGEDPAPGRCSRGCTCQLGGQLGLRKGGQEQAVGVIHTGRSWGPPLLRMYEQRPSGSEGDARAFGQECARQEEMLVNCKTGRLSWRFEADWTTPPEEWLSAEQATQWKERNPFGRNGWETAWARGS